MGTTRLQTHLSLTVDGLSLRAKIYNNVYELSAVGSSFIRTHTEQQLVSRNYVQVNASVIIMATAAGSAV